MRVTVDHFRKEAMRRKRGKRRGSSEYPKEMRKFAMAFARKAIAGGGTKAGSARDLGVSCMTLDKWLGESASEEDPTFREIVVEPEASKVGALVLVTPAGMRVEGLSVETAAELLTRLR